MVKYEIHDVFNVDIYYCKEVINSFALHVEYIEVSGKDYPHLARIKVCEELFTFEKRKLFNMFNMNSIIHNIVCSSDAAILFIEFEDEYGICFIKI